MRNSSYSIDIRNKEFSEISYKLEALKEVHTTSKLYRYEAAVALPKGLLTLRDSMIEVDESVSRSLRVEKTPGGVRIESKR